MESLTGEDAALWYLLLGSLMAVAATVRLLLSRDLMARLVAMNVVGVGSLLVLLSLGARSEDPAPDPVLSALVITGLVITVAFTGLGAVLIRRIEGMRDAELPADSGAADSSAADSSAADSGVADSRSDGGPDG